MQDCGEKAVLDKGNKKRKSTFNSNNKARNKKLQTIQRTWSIKPENDARKQNKSEVNESEDKNGKVIQKQADSKNEGETQRPGWQNPLVRAELDSRTLFVGNVIATIKKAQLLKFFSKYGKVQSVRLRCVTPVHPGVSKRLAVIKKLMHPKRTTLHSYITFENRNDALEAFKANGMLYKGHHLRVQMCDDLGKTDPKKAIFVGNLPFDAEDDDLWAALESCGQITSVRIIRDATTGMGVGVGYVNFESADSVELALQMENFQVKNKQIRIKRYQERKVRKEREHRQSKANLDLNKFAQEPETFKRPEQSKTQLSVPVKNIVFQGSKSNQKKRKRKVNKGVLQKMKISQKIAPRLVK